MTGKITRGNLLHYKEIIDNQLFVYMFERGKAILLYKRWFSYDKGRVFHEHEGN
jgi:hypothetical protein